MGGKTLNVIIEWLYKSKKETQTVFKSEELPAEQALKIAEDFKNGRTKQISFTSVR